MRIAALIVLCAGLVLAGCASPRTQPVVPMELSGTPAAPGVTAPLTPITPPLPTGPVSTIVLGSCLNEEFSRQQTALERMTARRADLAILMGDIVYGSSTPEDPWLSDLRSAYWQQARRREFTGLVSTTPTLAMWDDHDFGINDGGGPSFQFRDMALEMFRTFWRVAPGHPQWHQSGGVYGSYTMGPAGQRLQVILLDTRYNRSPLKPSDQRGAPGRERYIPDTTPGLTILGDAQWTWLEQQLRQPADLRLIVSSIQVVAEGHGWERWGNIPAERQRLYDLIRTTGAKGVVVLSGDRHHSAINRLPADAPGGVGYPLYDFTSSAINMPWSAGADEAGPLRITPVEGRENYGLVGIDWQAGQLTLSTYGTADELRFTQAIPFSEIGLR